MGSKGKENCQHWPIDFFFDSRYKRCLMERCLSAAFFCVSHLCEDAYTGQEIFSPSIKASFSSVILLENCGEMYVTTTEKNTKVPWPVLREGV
jgi:hypothetical protein